MNVKECKWEGLEFNPCDKYAANYEMSENGKTLSMRTGYNNWGHCPYCGANIHKPEPGVIIRKSGGTWVAQYNEIDYLWVGKKGYFPENKEIFLDYISNGMYKPISEIQITESLAHLNPIIKRVKAGERVDYGLYKLIHIEGEQAFYIKCCFDTGKKYKSDWMNKWNVAIATIKDLP